MWNSFSPLEKLDSPVQGLQDRPTQPDITSWDDKSAQRGILAAQRREPCGEVSTIGALDTLAFSDPPYLPMPAFRLPGSSPCGTPPGARSPRLCPCSLL